MTIVHISYSAQCQSAEFREKEAEAMATKGQCPELREREAWAMASKRQSADFREKLGL